MCRVFSDRGITKKIMINDKTKLKQITKITMSVMLASVVMLSACNRPKPNSPSANPSAAPAGEPVPEDPVTPGDDDNNGQSDMPQEPTDTPEPLPAPSQPVAAGQTITAKAIAKTTAYILPIGNIKGTYINIEVTWQPVIGASEYWIYKNIVPTKEQATKGSAYKIVKANGLLSTIFYDGIQPPSFAGGNIWDKVKQGFSAVTLKPGVEYKYKVIAVDADSNVIGESDAVATIPLPAIAAPTNIAVSETASLKPLFQWQVTDGVEPDGFYVSVTPPINFGKQAAPQGTSFGYAYWSTFRGSKTMLARYGSQSDNQAAYPGTLPFDVSFALKNANRYSVSVTSVKTDTNDMRTAKAISKGWSESKMFTTGVEQPSVTPTPAPTPSPSTSSSLWDKAKKLIGL